MKSKISFIVLALISLLFISTISFANNDIKNDIHNITDSTIDGTMQLGNEVKNSIQKASGSIEDGAKNLGNTISNGIQNMDNFMTDGMQNSQATMDNSYTATRTTASDLTNTDAMNSNLWTWGAIAVAGIVIVGLVWYYAAEHGTER